MKDFFKNLNSYRYQIKFAIIILFIFNGLFAIFSPYILNYRNSKRYYNYSKSYVVGQLSNQSISSDKTFAYEDKSETKKNQDILLKTFLPTFRYSILKTNLALNKIRDLLNIRIQEENINNLDLNYEEFKKINDKKQVILIALEVAQSILSDGIYDYSEIYKIEKIKAINEITEVKKEEETKDLITLSNLNKKIANYLKEYSLDTNEISFVFNLLNKVLEVNVNYDGLTTRAEKQQLINTVKKEIDYVYKGSLIIEKDTLITEKQLAKLQRLSELSGNFNIFQISLLLFLSFSILLIALLYFNYLFTNIQRASHYITIFLFIIALIQGISFAINYFYLNNSIVFLGYPIIAASVFMYFITDDYKIGILSAFLAACFLSLLPSSDIHEFFYLIITGFTALYLANKTKTRFDLILQWLATIIITTLVSLFIMVLKDESSNILKYALFALTGPSISYAIIFILLPISERIFNLATQFRLKELAYSESNLLNLMAKVAKGTYNHVTIVSDLSYQAAKAIKANALLTKAGSLYHDIGKLEHPEYFIENQTGDNKHDNMNPSLSAAVLKSHIKLGVEKAKEEKLPQEVIDIIAQHHGNDVIKYFLYKAQQSDDKANEVDYKYDSVPPTSKEAAIVMLADCTEAGTRSLKKISISSYSRFIDKLISDKIANKQLVDSHLTMTDLEKIKQSFIETLIGRDHSRIEYPQE